jgi:hypothetical protein
VPGARPGKSSSRQHGRTTQERKSIREDPRLYPPLQRLLVRLGAEYEKRKNADRRFAMYDFNPFFVHGHNMIPTLRFNTLLTVKEVPQAEVTLI